MLSRTFYSDREQALWLEAADQIAWKALKYRGIWSRQLNDLLTQWLDRNYHVWADQLDFYPGDLPHWSVWNHLVEEFLSANGIEEVRP